MKRFTVTVTTHILAEDEQAAWEYGNALASRAPSSVARGVDEDDSDVPTIEVEGA